MTEIAIDWTAEPSYTYKNNRTAWKKIGSGTDIIYLKSRGGAYRYPTFEELARDYTEIPFDPKPWVYRDGTRWGIGPRHDPILGYSEFKPRPEYHQNQGDYR